MNCKICNEEKNLVLGVCLDCTEAESIIYDGFDLNKKGPNNGKAPAFIAIDKLKFLIEKGWTKKNDLSPDTNNNIKTN